MNSFEHLNNAAIDNAGVITFIQFQMAEVETEIETVDQMGNQRRLSDISLGKWSQ